jgi:hypothetical protein
MIRHALLCGGLVALAASPAAAEPCGDEEAGSRCASVTADVVAGYRDGTLGGARASEFVLDRAELDGRLTWHASPSARGGVAARMQAVRSAGPQSLFGIEGDSIVLRMLEAYGHGAWRLGELEISARAGLIPERWIELVEGGYDLRALDALISDRRYFHRADLGASFSAVGWDGAAQLDLSVVNGEGLAQRELNAGKNSTLIATLRPVRKDALVWSVHAAYRDGSLGVGSARDHRVALASTVRMPLLVAGAELVRAAGLDARSELESHAASTWATVQLKPAPLGLAGKYDWIDQDRATSNAIVQRLTAGVFADALALGEGGSRLRLYLAYQHERFGEAAGALPGASEALEAHRALIVVHARGRATHLHAP